MSTNVCGNCSNFKPEHDTKFHNCTSAMHAGLSYGMQVRVDTRACDAFTPFNAGNEHTSAPVNPENRQIADDDQEVVGLCRMGQRTLVATVTIAIILVSWMLYTCASM